MPGLITVLWPHVDRYYLEMEPNWILKVTLIFNFYQFSPLLLSQYVFFKMDKYHSLFDSMIYCILVCMAAPLQPVQYIYCA